MNKSWILNFNFFGHVIRIECNDEFLLKQLSYIYKEYLEDHPQKIDYYFRIENKSHHDVFVSELISNNKLEIYHGQNTNDFQKWTDNATFLPPITVPFFRNKYSFFHGCAIQMENKTAIVLGPSRSGKTTLMMKLMDQGYKLISDDLLIIENETGKILPFKKPIGVRNTTKQFYQEKFKDIFRKLPNEMPTFNIEETGLTTELIHISEIENWSYLEEKSKIDNVFFSDQSTDVIEESYEFFKLFSNQACISNNHFQTMLKIYKNLDNKAMKINIRDHDVVISQMLDSINVRQKTFS